jgi:hypothetical protein
VGFRPGRTADSLTLEPRIAPASFSWSGAGADSNWTTDANWVGGTAPSAGSYLDFPSGAAQLSNVNDFPAGTSFSAFEIDAPGYDITGNCRGSLLLGELDLGPGYDDERGLSGFRSSVGRPSHDRGRGFG